MDNQQNILRRKDCLAPEINGLLTPYCFGRASDSERQLVEAHLLECDYCWREARRLDAAVRVLESDRSLLQTLTPAEIASALGLSSKLYSLFGGHWLHALAASGLYAALYAVALLGEIAYQFDRYGRASLWVAVAIFFWVFVTSLTGLAVDWKLTRDGSRKGIAASSAIFLCSALAVFAGACLFLPTNSVTEMNWQTYTAQAAYLKDIVYFLVLLVIFLLPPFHFVLAMQHELQSGRHKAILSLLTGDKLSLTPRSVLEKFATVQMLDVHLPTTDERTVILSRYTHPETDVQLLLQRLKLQLPAQPPPKITRPNSAGHPGSVVKT